MEEVKVLEKKVINTLFDVVVVGGGLTGVMAALSANREGKKVIVIEKNGCLGGMATAGLVNPFMSYLERGSKRFANAGLFKKLLDRMLENGAMEKPLTLEFKEQLLKIILDDIILETDIKVLFHSYLTDVNIKNGTIKSIKIATVSGNIDIFGKTFIDCTGDGNLFALSGYKFHLRCGPNDFSQPMTTNFNLINVDWSKFNRKEVNELYSQFKKEGKIKNPRENVLSMDSPIKDLMHFNTTRVVKKNPCDVEDVTESEMISRQQIREMFYFLKENVECFKNSELIVIGDEVGIRESRRIVGLYEVNEDDILSAKKFDDSICRGTYDIDIHNPDGSGTIIKQIPENDYYTIPYRALIPIDSKNLIVAGRCISCTHEAHSSLRIMPICACMGEAAGIASSLAIDNNCDYKDVDVKKLQAILVKNGALI